MLALTGLTLLFLFIYASLLMYYRGGWNSIPEFQKAEGSLPEFPFISVIVPARNEASNLNALLVSLKSQSYPKDYFEVIVMDDFSEDNTPGIVHSFPMDNLQLVKLKDHVPVPINSYKKKAIETGISLSKGQVIVTTDADCIMENSWLYTIAAFYSTSNASLIVMPVAIEDPGNFFEIFQALDFMVLQGITGAAVYHKIHSMCNGANLAYSKSAFKEVGGFTGIDHIASGDDMLLMHKISKLYPGGIKYLKASDVIVETSAAHTISEFMNQRIRWASKADKYDDKRITLVLLMVYSFNLLLFILPIASIFQNEIKIGNEYHVEAITVWIIILLLKLFVECIFLYPVATFLKKVSLLWFFPFLQPFHIVYTIIAGFLGKFGRYHWKNRMVK
jgi:cellulose synthase/poly-beta-1,6-N-acetylglucosamine synthase-like glycosyltransferase